MFKAHSFANKIFTSKSPLWLAYHTLLGAGKIFQATKDPLRDPIKILCLFLGFIDKCVLNLNYLGKIKVDIDDVKENFLQTIISACSMDLTVTQQKKSDYNSIQKKKKIIDLNV